MTRHAVLFLTAALAFAAGYVWALPRGVHVVSVDAGIVATHRGDYPVRAHGPWRS